MSVHRPHKLLAPRRAEQQHCNLAGLVSTDSQHDTHSVRHTRAHLGSCSGGVYVGSTGASMVVAGACRTRARARTRGRDNPARASCYSGSSNKHSKAAGTELGNSSGTTTTADARTGPTTATTTTVATTTHHRYHRRRRNNCCYHYCRPHYWYHSNCDNYYCDYHHYAHRWADCDYSR